jgi:putative PEP-CTERM system TPR-repeat lipoprotein
MQPIRLSILFIILVASLSACDQSTSAKEYMQSGQAYVDNKEWKSAIIEFKNAVKQDPKNANARAKLGTTYLKTYSANAAIKELNRAIALGHKKSELLIPLAMAYRLSSDFTKIIEDINVDTSQSANEQAQILALRAIAYLSINNDEEALIALNKAKQLDDQATEVRLVWAGFEGDRGNTTEQIAWLAPLLEREGGIAEAWSQMGRIESEANNSDAAEKAYSRSIELRDEIHIDSMKRASIRVKSKDLKGAQSDVDALKKAGASWPMVGHIDGVIAFQEGNLDLAISSFKDVLSRASNFPPSQFMLALINFNNQNYQAVVTLLAERASNNPEELQSNLIFAGSLLELNQVDRAMVVLNKLVDKHPEEYRVLALLGDGYMRLRQPNKANTILKKSVLLKPDQAVARFQLGASMLSDKSTRAQGQQELIAAIEIEPNLRQAELTLFKSYLIEKRFSDALSLADNRENNDPDSSIGANMVAMTFMAEDKKEQAINKLNDTLKQFPDDFPTTHNLARIHLQDDDFGSAKKLYQSLLEKKSSNLETLNQLAVIAAREKNKDQMMLRLTQAQERNPDKLSPRIALASQYLRINDTLKAITILNGAKPEQKEGANYILLMAEAKMVVGEQQHAERLLTGLTARKPEIAAAHFLLARSYSASNNAVKVRASLQKVIDLQPKQLAANIIMAKLDLLEGKVDDFISRVALLDKAFPDQEQVLFLKAKVESGDSNYGGAIDTLSSLMAKTPNTEIIVDLSKNQWQSGDKQAAISSLQLWTEENKDDSQALMLLAQFYMAEDRLGEAKVTYEKLNLIAGDNPVVLNNLAWLLGDTNPEQGIKYAIKALSLNSNSPFTQDTIAMLYMKSKQYNNALPYATNAAIELPKNAEVQFNYASVLAANNQVAKAKEWLNDMLKKATTDESKQLIEDQLEQL